MKDYGSVTPLPLGYERLPYEMSKGFIQDRKFCQTLTSGCSNPKITVSTSRTIVRTMVLAF
jgi:hypothetical protein